MTDFWADRIKLNQAPEIKKGAGDHGTSTGGSLDSHNAAMSTKITDTNDVSGVKPGPKNEAPSWSA